MLLAFLVYILRLTHCINCELIKLSENSMHIVLHTQKTTLYKFKLAPVYKYLFKVNMNGLTKMSASIVFVSLLLILNRNLSLGATLERHFSLIRWKKGPYINTIFTAKYFYKKETLLKLINSYQLVQLVIFFEIREKFMNSSEPLSLSLK